MPYSVLYRFSGKTALGPEWTYFAGPGDLAGKEKGASNSRPVTIGWLCSIRVFVLTG